MQRPGNFQFRFEILLLFVVLEVVLFGANSTLQLIVTIAEYLFLLYVILFKEKEIGIMYFLTFTLLSLGLENYGTISTLPPTFWGFRVMGFSFNILFSILVLIICLVSDNFKWSMKKISRENKFLLFFILYSSFVGLIYILLLDNYIDNFKQDILTYYPFFIYLYLLSFLNKESTIKIIKYGFALTVIMMVLSLITHKMMQYGLGNYFVLQNSFAYIMIVAIFMMKDFYNRWVYFGLILTMLFLLVNGNIFIGGKQIILFIVVLIWILITYWKSTPFFALGVLISVFFLKPIFQIAINHYMGSIISFKLTQVYSILDNINFTSLAKTKSSIGNIIAEGITLYHYEINNILILFFGKGFGGGIPDLFGYLGPWAGSSGYAAHDLLRNDFHKLHLPIFEILLKSGIIGLILYSVLIIKMFLKKNMFTFLSLLMLATVFYVNKEQLLLTMIFLKIANETEYKRTHETSMIK